MMSTIGNYAGQYTSNTYPWIYPVLPGNPNPDVSREEFEALRQEMQELRKLLIAAKEYDRATGQPDCETEEKVALLKRVAELVGVDLGDVFGA